MWSCPEARFGRDDLGGTLGFLEGRVPSMPVEALSIYSTNSSEFRADCPLAGPHAS